MTNEEIIKIIKTSSNSDHKKELMQKLFDQNRTMTRKFILKYCPTADTEMEDLMQESYFALYDAVEKFDCNSEFKFLTLYQHYVHQICGTYSKKQNSILSVSSDMLTLLTKYKRIYAEFKKEFNRNPTDEEMADKLHVELETIELLIELVRKPRSLNEQVRNDQDDTTELQNLVPDSNNPIDAVIESAYSDEVWRAVEKNVSTLQNYILREVFLHNRSYAQLSRELNIKDSQIRSLASKAFICLRREQARKVFMDKVEKDSFLYLQNTHNFSNGNWGSSVEELAIRHQGQEKGWQELKKKYVFR